MGWYYFISDAPSTNSHHLQSILLYFLRATFSLSVFFLTLAVLYFPRNMSLQFVSDLGSTTAPPFSYLYFNLMMIFAALFSFAFGVYLYLYVIKASFSPIILFLTFISIISIILILFFPNNMYLLIHNCIAVILFFSAWILLVICSYHFIKLRFYLYINLFLLVLHTILFIQMLVSAQNDVYFILSMVLAYLFYSVIFSSDE